MASATRVLSAPLPRSRCSLLAAIGIVQDTLLWLLVSWIGSQMDYGVHVDGFLTALAGGAVMRLTVLAVMAIGPQPVPEAA